MITAVDEKLGGLRCSRCGLTQRRPQFSRRQLALKKNQRRCRFCLAVPAVPQEVAHWLPKPFKVQPAKCDLYVPPTHIMGDSLEAHDDNEVEQETHNALFLVRERHRGPQSDWFPFICSLPTELGACPLFLSRQALMEGFTGTLTGQLVTRRVADLTQRFLNLGPPSDITFHEFVWAATLFRALGFAGRLVPLATEHVNSNKPTANWRFDAEGGFLLTKRFKSQPTITVSRAGRRSQADHFIDQPFPPLEDNEEWDRTLLTLGKDKTLEVRHAKHHAPPLHEARDGGSRAQGLATLETACLRALKDMKPLTPSPALASERAIIQSLADFCTSSQSLPTPAEAGASVPVAEADASVHAQKRAT